MERKNIIILLLLVAILLSPSTICSQTITMTDDLGHRLELNHCPQRIISLAPNLTEILFALGLEDKIIGVTRFCDYPEKARKKEIIGGLIDPSLEKIQVLQPDLVLGFRGNPRRVLENFYQHRIPLFVFETGRTFDDLFRLVKRIGQLTCHQAQANQLISSMQEKIEQIDKKLASIKPEKKVFLTLSGQGPGLWTCGRNSYLAYLLDKARVKNVSSSLQGNWLLYSREKLIEDNPEIILILARDEDSFQNGRDWFLSQPALQKIKAIRLRKFIYLDENIFSRFGPRLVLAYEQLIQAIYPELLSEAK